MHQWSFAIFMPHLRDAELVATALPESRTRLCFERCRKTPGGRRFSLVFAKNEADLWSLKGTRVARMNLERGLGYTPRKLNMEHQNGGSEDEFPFQLDDF